MNHECFDKFKKLIIVEGEFRRHEAVNLLWCAQFSLRFQEDDDVCVWKPSLLKLYGIEEPSHGTKYAILDVIDEGLKLGMEDAHHQVRTIRSLLARQQCILNLRPTGVGSHGHKKIPSSKVAIDGQGILAMLLHVSGASSK